MSDTKYIISAVMQFKRRATIIITWRLFLKFISSLKNFRSTALFSKVWDTSTSNFDGVVLEILLWITNLSDLKCSYLSHFVPNTARNIPEYGFSDSYIPIFWHILRSENLLQFLMELWSRFYYRSQILANTGRFELQIFYMQCSYLISLGWIRVHFKHVWVSQNSK